MFRNLVWAVERINARGGVARPNGKRPLEPQRFDSKGNTEEALSMLHGALERHAAFVLQGNSSATAAALIDALEKHNEREPAQHAVLLDGGNKFGRQFRVLAHIGVHRQGGRVQHFHGRGHSGVLSRCHDVFLCFGVG